MSCEDWSGNTVNYSAEIIIDSPKECIIDCEEIEKESEDVSKLMTLPLAIGIGLILVVLIGMHVVRSRSREEETETWHNEENAPERDERIPEGWTLEEFLNWLDGPMPDDWQEEQWELYKLSLEDLR